ncbi:MAG: hypothetical protein M0037_05720 [Betaproteobacteria bacterium]|nr:hypothetical protein [Betaproteobacteria bacterium]
MMRNQPTREAYHIALRGALALGLFSLWAAAQAGCPPNSVQIGQQEEREGNLIIIHPVCQVLAPPPRTYTPSGNGFVGGTTWANIGYNVQGKDPALAAKERAMLERQMRLAGVDVNSVNLKKYNFIIGMAASSDAMTDLKKRVLDDEFSNGQASAAEQALYDSLKGRSFDQLGCHSNGAMICLAALMNKDIEADHVVLYGPQLSASGLAQWDQLVQSGQVKSVEIDVDQSDPVPPVSLLAGSGADNQYSDILFDANKLSEAITSIAPNVAVKTFPCGNGKPSLACHAMTAYRRNTEAAR